MGELRWCLAALIVWREKSGDKSILHPSKLLCTFPLLQESKEEKHRFPRLTTTRPKSFLNHYSREAVGPSVIQAQLGPYIVTIITTAKIKNDMVMIILGKV